MNKSIAPSDLSTGKSKNKTGFNPLALFLVLGVFIITLSFLAFIISNTVIASTTRPAEFLNDLLATPTIFSEATNTSTPFLPLPTLTPTVTSTFTLTPTHTQTSIPTETPTQTNVSTIRPTNLPQAPLAPDSTNSAVFSVGNISGQNQSYPLSCEARSAVDWANFFGVSISETEFLNGLPQSDDPEEGYVGSYLGVGGQIPPASYGVHAPPVSALLRAYGLPAQERRSLSWDTLQEEIRSGEPVIVWVIFGISNGVPIAYTAENGNSTIVARNEHTVIVTGYSDTQVIILDGGWHYSSSINQFLNSWGVLGNMAIVYSGNGD